MDLGASTAAVSEVVVDDGGLRITRWTFPPGSATGMHVHEYRYVVVPVSGGEFSAVMPDGTSMSLEQVAGVPYVRDAGVEHDIVNANEAVQVFLEIEILR